MQTTEQFLITEQSTELSAEFLIIQQNTEQFLITLQTTELSHNSKLSQTNYA
jgi:hypothetical protein